MLRSSAESKPPFIDVWQEKEQDAFVALVERLHDVDPIFLGKEAVFSPPPFLAFSRFAELARSDDTATFLEAYRWAGYPTGRNAVAILQDVASRARPASFELFVRGTNAAQILAGIRTSEDRLLLPGTGVSLSSGRFFYAVLEGRGSSPEKGLRLAAYQDLESLRARYGKFLFAKRASTQRR